MFVHLRGRGTYSMLEGIGSLNSIFQTAKDLGQTAIALTDLNGVYGLVDFYSKSKGFEMKPILGVELLYTPDVSLLSPTKDALSGLGTVVLLITSHQGYHTLLRLLTMINQKLILGQPVLDAAALRMYHEDLIVMVGGIGSYAYTQLQQHSQDEMHAHIQQMIEICGSDYVIVDVMAQSYKHYPILAQLNPALLEQAKLHQLKVVTTSAYRYPKASQKTAYETALAIKDVTKVYDSNSRKVLGEHHILSEDEIRTILLGQGHQETDIQQWIDTTTQLADFIQTKISLGQALFPAYVVPDDVQVLYKKYGDILINDQ